MSLPENSDVIVIGGGIMGLFTALNLAERGRSVTILERNLIWGEASGVNAGSLAVQNKLPPLVPFTLAAFDIWKSMAARLGHEVDYHQTGGYKIATSPFEVARLKSVAELQRAVGLPVVWMDPGEIRSQTPWLSDDVLAATYCPLDSFASPTHVGPALAEALRKTGVGIVENVKVTGASANGVVRLESSRGPFVAQNLVMAAGAWSGSISSMLGAHLPVSLDVNMISVTEPAPKTIGKIVTHARGILTLKQVANGSCLIGGGWQGIGSIDDARKDLEFDQLAHNLILATRVVPGLRSLHILRSWAGYEGVSPDSLPYLGRVPGHANVYVAACARGGFTLGPLLAQLLSELIVTGGTSMPIELFNPGRFGNG